MCLAVPLPLPEMAEPVMVQRTPLSGAHEHTDFPDPLRSLDQLHFHVHIGPGC